MIGSILSALVILSLVSIGIGAFVAPGRSAAQYGIVLDDPRALAFIRAMGARDLVIGGLLGLMALEGARRMLGCGMYLTAVIALADLVVVVRDRRTAGPAPGRDPARALHAGGAIGLVVAATAVLAGW